MCGRLTQIFEPDELVRFFSVAGGLALAPRFNLAPSQLLAVIARPTPDAPRTLELARWGLVPPWSRDAKGYRTINARAETLSEKPAYRAAFRSRRCLVPANGFYEWRHGEARRRQPFFIHRRDGGPMAFAGLWEPARGPDAETSCAIVTTAANALVAPLHDRMPAILAEADFDSWLDPGTPEEPLRALLRPFPEGELEAYPVSTIVNSAAVDDARCLERRPEERQLALVPR